MTFRIRWAACGKEEVTDLRAASADDARRAFTSHRLPGVSIVSIEPTDADPDAPAPPVPSGPSDSPFEPLAAHRRMDDEDDVR
jgi:hypothetical protein